MDLAPGQTLDRYRLVAELGEGGQGTVWRAIDPLRAGAHVALKVMRLPGARPVDIDRLRNEARALARLSHPSIVRCHGLFEDLHRDVLGLVLDLVEGRPLSSLMRDPRLVRRHRESLLRHLAGALSAMHAAGIVHRDLKPANVLLRAAFFDDPGSPANVQLIDLGIAAPTGNPRPLTNPGAVIGTAPYMAPEIIDPQRWADEPMAGPQRDVFAFGVMAMELLRGVHPTGLPQAAKLGEFAAAYSAYGDRAEAWPPGVRDDPNALLFERSLALRASRRAPNGGTLMELLQATEIDERSAGVARTEVSQVPPMRVSPVRPTMQREEDPSRSSPPTLRDPSSRTRWVLAACSIPIAGGIAFLAAKYSRETTSSLPADEGSATPVIAPLRPSSAPAPVPSVVRGCPASRVLVNAMGELFCIDVAPVTVDAYEARAGAAPRDADWPGPTATIAAVEAQTKRCAAGKADRKLPLNCIDGDRASAYCAATGGRLPSSVEWSTAMQTATIHPADGFEWTRDARGAQDFLTCRSGAGCNHGNPRSARNADLGFRCVGNPL